MREGHYPRSIFWIAGSLSALAPLSIDFYLPGLPHLTADLGVDTSIGQLTITACLLGIAVSQLFAGAISDGRGRRRLILGGLLCCAAVSVLCALAPDAWALIGLRLLQGAAVGTGFVLSRAIIRDVYRGNAAARIFARLVLISGIAPVLAPTLGAAVLSVTSWRGIFVIVAAVALILAIFSFFRLPETLPSALRQEPGLRRKLQVYRGLLGDRCFLPYAGAGSLAFAAMFAYIAGSPFVLENVFDLSPQAFGLAFGLNALGMVLCSQLSSRLVERTGPRALLTAGAVAMAAGGTGLLAVTLAGGGLVPFLACLVLSISPIGLILPNATALALAGQSRAAGSAAALFGLGQFGIGALAAPLVGVAGSDDALPMALTIAVCGCGALVVERRAPAAAGRG